MKIIAVTGTNGKTSTIWMLHQLLLKEGFKVVSYHSIGFSNEEFELLNYPLDKGRKGFLIFLQKMAARNLDFLIVEVTSFALSQRIYQNIIFDAAIVTSIGSDHLDVHKTQTEYLNSKMILFSKCMSRHGIVLASSHSALISPLLKASSEIGFRLCLSDTKKNFNCLSWTRKRYSIDATFRFENFDSIRVSIPSPFKFLLDNFSLALYLFYELLRSSPIKFLNDFKFSIPPGRGEILNGPVNQNICVDYAHNAEALEVILRELNIIYSNKPIVVLGCGGNRDQFKRSRMGKIASLLSNKVIITDDNPRKEDPKLIRQDILLGCKNNAIEIPNRTNAIEFARNIRYPNQCILLAGMGHEENLIST
ncbi:MAG: Mur ligase family protein [Flavobacteriaceae bacterium]